MALHVIVGAGPVGSATAELLAAEGHRVRVVSRRGTGPQHESIERVAADASDADTLTRVAHGAQSLINCASPPYDKWAQLWPPLADAILDAAQRTEAVLVTMGNLYGYGPVAGPMTEDLPLAATTIKGRVRARMWTDALAAHTAGRVRATEARASDYLGARASSAFTQMVLPGLRAGKKVSAPINFDVAHSVTYIPDAARTLVVLAADERAWGRAWHVPSHPPITFRQISGQIATALGAPAPRLATLPVAMLRLGAFFSPMAKAFAEMHYQFDRPFVMDSSAAQRAFGFGPSPWEEIIASTR